MARIVVHKFGGTSVGDAARIESVAALLAGTAESHRIIVASAMTGTTDNLLQAAAAAAARQTERALEIVGAFASRHEMTLAAIDQARRTAIDTTGAELQAILAEVTDLVRAVASLGELTPRTRDRIVASGEKLSVRLVARALRHLGLSARAVDADGFIETDGHFGESSPLAYVTEAGIRNALQPLLDEGTIPVVTGFVGHAPDGSTTTLGRGGSDYSATLIGAALRADEVVIWTDVEGVFTADPRIVPDARPIPQLNFREAAELSFYGAKVLHQRTIQPVANLGIPVWIKNSFAPAQAGTVVDGRFTPGSHPVKAISAVRGQALISVEGRGMAGVPGVAARVFGALAARQISVTMICQSSSEASICFAVPNGDALAAEMALKREFRMDISHGDIEEVVVQRNVGVVAAVGLGMAHTPGVASRVLGALARRRISVVAIAQGASELNISLAVDDGNIGDAVRAIHHEFGLHRLDTGDDQAGALDLIVFGFGKIGRALATLVRERREHIEQRFGVRPRIVAVGDRSGFLFAPRGLTEEQLESAVQCKAQGGRLSTLEGAHTVKDPTLMVRHALGYRLSRPVLVDVTDAEESLDLFVEAMRGGCDVVTANKKPLAAPYAAYQSLRETERAAGRVLRAEATVGAGLPVIDTLEMLLATGDHLVRAEGSLSGTLAFVMGRLEAGEPFSQAVKKAVSLGYTEPDPVADLTGDDVARKAIILGRISGMADRDLPLAQEGLVDRSLAGRPLPELLEALEAYDEPIRRRLEEARQAGCVLRYVARVERGQIQVGPIAVPVDSALARLAHTDNMVVFSSERYSTRPLVVTGPGAGVEVTAMGVLSDILRIAAERS